MPRWLPHRLPGPAAAAERWGEGRKGGGEKKKGKEKKKKKKREIKRSQALLITSAHCLPGPSSCDPSGLPLNPLCMQGMRAGDSLKAERC